MKPILVINPNSTETVTANIDRALDCLRFADGPPIECLTLVEGPPGIESQQTADRIQQAVAQMYLVPNETPTVAQIKDKSKLGNQEFFKNAHNGDYLLLYKNNKLALVYRESVKKLVNVGPLAVDAGSERKDAPATPELPAKTNP